jgi:hypothetical protein
MCCLVLPFLCSVNCLSLFWELPVLVLGIACPYSVFREFPFLCISCPSVLTLPVINLHLNYSCNLYSSSALQISFSYNHYISKIIKEMCKITSLQKNVI